MNDRECFVSFLGLPKGTSDEDALAIWLVFSQEGDADSVESPCQWMTERILSMHVCRMCASDDAMIRDILGLPLYPLTGTADIIALFAGNSNHCPRCGKFTGYDGHCGKCGYTLPPDKMEQRARKLLAWALRDGKIRRIQGLGWRKGLGRIDIEVGKHGAGPGMVHGSGLVKIMEKHDNDLSYLPTTLSYGVVCKVRVGNNPLNPVDENTRAIVHNGFVAFLDRTRPNVWHVTTHHFDERKAQLVLALGRCL